MHGCYKPLVIGSWNYVKFVADLMLSLLPSKPDWIPNNDLLCLESEKVMFHYTATYNNTSCTGSTLDVSIAYRDCIIISSKVAYRRFQTSSFKSAWTAWEQCDCFRTYFLSLLGCFRDWYIEAR